MLSEQEPKNSPKKLFSFMIDPDILKKLKNIQNITAAELVRKSIGNRKESKHKIIWIQPYYTGNNLPTHNKKYSLQP